VGRLGQAAKWAMAGSRIARHRSGVAESV
jgi:hypothetical protein